MRISSSSHNFPLSGKELHKFVQIQVSYLKLSHSYNDGYSSNFSNQLNWSKIALN